LSWVVSGVEHFLFPFFSEVLVPSPLFRVSLGTCGGRAVSTFFRQEVSGFFSLASRTRTSFSPLRKNARFLPLTARIMLKRGFLVARRVARGFFSDFTGLFPVWARAVRCTSYPLQFFFFSVKMLEHREIALFLYRSAFSIFFPGRATFPVFPFFQRQRRILFSNATFFFLRRDVRLRPRRGGPVFFSEECFPFLRRLLP